MGYGTESRRIGNWLKHACVVDPTLLKDKLKANKVKKAYGQVMQSADHRLCNGKVEDPLKIYKRELEFILNP
jgi:energy-coupling factor transporter ATP-binding protein EcfA2